MHVLIVEDDAVMRRMLEAQLSRLGHQVEAAPGGAEAWGVLAALHYPLVVCDWMMPGMDGLELCRRIRARTDERYTYVILLTSLTGKERYLEAMAAGADDFVTKPPDIEELAARIRVAERVLGLQTRVRNLEELLPICSYCKRIRDERDRWNPVEEYLSEHTDRRLTHGVCPDCYETRLKPYVEDG